MNKKAFTLIELLVVVLIIGILAAVALPQYQKAVEKARMTEAIINVRAIARAAQVFQLENGNWPGNEDMDALALEIKGTSTILYGIPRIATQDWLYSIHGSGAGAGTVIAVANRRTTDPDKSAYYILIRADTPDRIRCGFPLSNALTSDMQTKLCNQLNDTGTL